MFAIFARELRDRRTSLIAYCGVVVALVVVYVSLFPSVKQSMAQFQQIYESYPKGFYKALGIEQLSINTLENFLAIELFSFVWPIVAILLAVSRAGGNIAGDIERGTMGLYLALPISRAKLLLTKLLSSLSSILIFAVVTILGIIPIAAAFNAHVGFRGIAYLAGLSLLFAWAIYAVALFFSTVFSERSKVYMTMGGGLIIMYAVNVIAGLKDGLVWLGNYTVFHYYNAQDILSGGSIKLSSVLVYGATIALFTVLAVLTFRNRDVAV